MLHTSRKKRSKKPLIIIISALVVIVVGWLYYAHHYQAWPFHSTNQPKISPIDRKVNYSPPSNDQTKSGADTKSQVVDGNTKEGSTAQPPSAQQNTLGVTITTIQPGQTVYVRAIINSVLSSGTCTLTMNGPNSKVYSATASVQPMASSSTCQGFNIPMTSLTSGSWKITITVTDGASSGSATAEKTL